MKKNMCSLPLTARDFLFMTFVTGPVYGTHARQNTSTNTQRLNVNNNQRITVMTVIRTDELFSGHIVGEKYPDYAATVERTIAKTKN